MSKCLYLAVLVLLTSLAFHGHCTTFNWKGTTSSDWATGANWDKGTVPTTADAVQIGVVAFTGSQPAVSTNQTVTSLTIAGTVTLMINTGINLTISNTVSNSGTFVIAGSGTITISGNYSNTGSYTQTAGTTIFNGSATQLLNDTGNGTSFYNVTFTNTKNNVMQLGTFSIASTGTMTLTGTNTKVTLANATLIFKSDATGSATLAAIPTGGRLNSNNKVIVQRYMQANRAYRLMSSPVYDSIGTSNYYSVNYIKNSAPLTGTTGTAGGFDKGNNPTLYLYRENLAPLFTTFLNSDFRGINNITASPSYTLDVDGGPYHIPVGNGFLFYYRGSLHQKSLASLTVPGAAATNDTLAAVGTVNQGNISVQHWYTGASNLLYTTVSGTPTVEGSNLVGNPYPSSIDWDKSDSTNTSAGIYAPHVAPFCYTLVATNAQGAGNYNVYQANTDVGGDKEGTQGTPNSNVIASGEGFFVFATSASASMTFSENAKTSSQNTGANLYMSSRHLAAVTGREQSIRLQMFMDSINSDGLIIRFTPAAKPAYSPSEDARYKAGSGKVSFSSMSSDNVPLAINQLPLAIHGDTIRLNVHATSSGNYSLGLKGITGIPALYDILVKDQLTGDTADMRKTVYNFSVNTGDTTSYGANRFLLILRQNPALAYKLLSFDAEKMERRAVQLSWKTQNEADYTHFTIERSNDGGKTFSTLSEMRSNGAGSYSFTDQDPLKGDNQYHLKSVDYFGNVTFSNIADEQFQDNGNDKAGRVSCNPNPATTFVHLNIAQGSKHETAFNIRIYNSLGLMVRSDKTNGFDWQANISELQKGSYVIRVTDQNEGFVGETKVVKL